MKLAVSVSIAAIVINTASTHGASMHEINNFIALVEEKQGFYTGMLKYSLGESYGILMSFKVKLVQHFKVISQVM